LTISQFSRQGVFTKDSFPSGQFFEEEFDQAVYDIVNFLYYTGEPSRLERHRTGVYVILFLVILYVFTFLLGREFQKDVR